ncbi:MAG: HAD family phosphatase [Candidatus Peregrinibacteria bacterium]
MHALLLDLDGTLIDSFPLWAAANLHMLELRGISLTEQKFLTDFYQPGLHHHGILEKCGLPTDDAEKFYQERNQLYTRYLAERIEWMDDAGAVLERCKEILPLGLMSGTTRKDIEAIDRRLHLSSLFQEIVTFDDTGKRMKPDPYGLLLLTEKLGVDPKECAYVGDQYVDVQAARDAGMECWLLQTPNTPAQAIKEADLLLASIGDIPMERLVKGGKVG